jgi:hypothetical protein
VARTLRIAQGKQADVVRAAREALEARGARLREMTHSRTTFDRLAGPGSFPRGGYLGVYQPMGEPGVDVLVQAWAAGPRAAYWGMATLSVVLVAAMLVASPPSAVFFLAALVLWPLFGLAAFLYYLTFRGSAQVEDELAADLAQRLAGAGLHVLGEEEQLERSIRERLEGEAKARALAAQPKPAKAERRRGQRAKEKRALFGSRKER